MSRAQSIVFATAILVVAVVIGYAKWPRSALPENAKADRIVVVKSERRMQLFSGATLLREYRVALGFQPSGPKEMEGDGKTPEGLYVIDYRNQRSQFHLSLHVSYPRPEQVARAKKKGISPGGMIMIHGLRNGAGFLGRFHRLADWTTGCIAVTNEEIEEIWRVVPDGTSIEIRA